MDVQGDYNPVDAGGFIKVNALRYVSLIAEVSASANEQAGQSRPKAGKHATA